MAKPKLGIDIDEILRAKWQAFDRFYVEEFGEEGVTEPFDTYNLRNHYKFEDTTVELQVMNEDFLENESLQKISPKEYIVDEATGRAAVDDFAFKTETKTYTADEMFEKFLYEDYMYEIHASAPKLYMNADVDMNTFLKLFGEHFEVFFYAKTRKLAIPSTLFFLSKMRVEVKNIAFVYSDEEVWEKFDWVVTTDPAILLTKPEDKVTLKLMRMYNSELDADYTSEIGTMFGFTSTEKDEEGNSQVGKFQKFLSNKLNLTK